MTKVIHYAVHPQNIGTKSVNLHIQSEPSISRNWCIKVSFISLLTFFFGFVGLIIGNSFFPDLSTPVQKSRYFDVDEVNKYDLHYEAFKEVGEHEIHCTEDSQETHNKEAFDNAIYENDNENNKHLVNNNQPKSSKDENIQNDEKDNNAKNYNFSTQEYGRSFESSLQKIVHQASENNAGDSEEKTSLPRTLPPVDSATFLEHNFEFIEAELKRAEDEIIQNNLQAGIHIYESLAVKYPDSPATLYGKVKALKEIGTITESNDLLQTSVNICIHYLEHDGSFSDEEFKTLSYFCIDQMRTINLFHQAVPIHYLLIKRFDDDPRSRNELADTYINIHRVSDAKNILKENLKRWPDNGLALVKYGQLLLNSSVVDGIHFLRLGIETDDAGTQTWFFYTMLGNALLRSNRSGEGREIFRKGVAKQIFHNEYQRPGTFFGGLKVQPIWTKEETTYIDIFNLLESNWKHIRDDGISILNQKGYFKDEDEDLLITGIWTEFILAGGGKKDSENCKIAQFTCNLIEVFSAARNCMTGRIKYSAIYPGTHIKPHCGPHNSRLRAHLGLKVPNGTRIRIGEDERSWKEGEFLIFDDSFEHEIWHNGNSTRLVLIIDFWHPQVTDDHKKIIQKIKTAKTRTKFNL